MRTKADIGVKKNMIKKYKNILPIDKFEILWKTISNTPWIYGHKTFAHGAHGIPFFCQKIEENYNFYDPFKHLCKEVKNLIQKDIHDDLYPIWIKVNGQVYGQDGSFHQDYKEDSFYTFVFFPAPTWDLEWGGEFIVYDKNIGEYIYSPPLPNTGIVFPSNFEHVGTGPRRNYPSIRVSVALNFCTKDALPFIDEFGKKVIEL